ncbi:MAG: tryptophan synthase subunit alpha [Acidobacteriota bacterium]|nr:tryptophan synthase subunit alpha [Acidobacteriota bacterium]
MTGLERTLRSLRGGGRTALAPYFVAGLSADWTQHVLAAVQAGADVVEIGLPFSDPMMDGVVIQEASRRSLERGTTFETVLSDLESLAGTAPLVLMTYYNLLLHYGLERAAGRLAEAGVSGAVVPDLTLEESGPWRDACGPPDLSTVFLVAPSTPPARVALVSETSQGFVYASARMAVTGAAEELGDAESVAASVRACTDRPCYVGIGISTPAHAARAGEVADGVIVGSALVRVLLEGGGPHEVERFVRGFRRALD